MEKALRKAVSDEERRLRRVEDEYDADEITKAEYQRRRKNIRERLDANEAALAKATRSRVHTRLPTGTELRAQWPQKDIIW
jgi:site-specific DNA recombinase